MAFVVFGEESNSNDYDWFQSLNQQYFSYFKITTMEICNNFIKSIRSFTNFDKGVVIRSVTFESVSYKFNVRNDELDDIQRYYFAFQKDGDQDWFEKSSIFSNHTFDGLEPETRYKIKYRIYRKIDEKLSIMTSWEKGEDIITKESKREFLNNQ